MFTDIVGSTAYFEQRGDLAGMDMLQRHNSLLLPLVEVHRGTVVKTIGDAIMAAWSEPTHAARCAIAMQERLAQHNREVSEGERIRVRIGLHFGPVVCQDGDLFGDVVNAAARVEGLAGPGQVLVAAAVRAELRDDLRDACVFFDAVRVKGKQAPIEVFELRWDPNASAPDSRSVLAPGTHLAGGRYELGELLGVGGMGSVYRATDLSLKLDLALKFLQPEVAARRDALERFKEEVRLARTLSHPNVCRIHDFVRSDEQVYLSMELVDGETLEEVLSRGKLGPEAALPIVRGVCAGLEAAHRHGVVHRDLKPANVMLERKTGRVVLMDFGIAQLSERSEAGEHETVLGTPEYMAPEQVLGEKLGPTTDVYALGVLIYEMLSGDVPHRGETPTDTVTRHLEDTPLPLAQAAPGTPPRWCRTVDACLRRDPQDRPASAQDALTALSPSAGPPLRRRWVALAGLVALSLLLAGGLAWLNTRSSVPPGQLAVRGTRPLVVGRPQEQWPRWRRPGAGLLFTRARRLWLSNGAGAEQPWGGTLRPQTSEALAGISAAPDGEHAFVAARTASGEAVVARVALNAPESPPAIVLERAAAPDVSPDGRWIAFVDVAAHGRHGLALARADGSERKLLVPAEESRSYLQPRFSPDGRSLVLVVHQLGYESTRDVALYPLPEGPLRLVTRDGVAAKRHNCDPTWGPQGRWLVYASKRSGRLAIWQVPLDGGGSLPLTAGALAPQRSPELSPDGSRLLVASRTEHVDIALRDVKGGRLSRLTEDPWMDRFPVFSPDGLQVAFRTRREGGAGSHRVVSIVDRRGGVQRSVMAPRGMRDFCWCGPSTLAYAATTDGDRLLGLLELSTGASRVLVSGFHRLWSPSCSADGDQIVFGGRRHKDDSRQIWQVEGANPSGPSRLTGAPGVASAPTMHPHRAVVAYRWAPGSAELGQTELRVLELRPGATPTTLPQHPSLRGARRRIRFSPDGASLLYLERRGRGAQLWRAPVDGGAAESLVRLSNVHLCDFDVSPDGQTVVYPKTDRRGDLHVLDLEPTDG